HGEITRLAYSLHGHGAKHYGSSWLWQQVAPCTTADNDHKGIHCSLVSRLSTAIGPLLVETGLGHFSTRSWVSTSTLVGASVTRNNPSMPSGPVQTMTCLHECPRAVGKIPALVLVSSDQQLYRNRYWLTPQVRPKTVQATTLVCSDGDSTNMWRLCIAPKYVTRQLLDTSGFSRIPVSINREHWHKISDACAHGMLSGQQKSLQIGI
ncbi:hypothetical protein BASA60_000891, partial [Batrachochytrium salamandrivorans]